MKTSACQKLLAAAPALAAEVDYDELSIARLCEAAAVSRHEFKLAFGELPAYFEALQQQFLDGLRTRMLKVTDGTSPGLLRIKLASECYLGYCLEIVDLRIWLLASRAHPAVLRLARQQNANYEFLLGSELRAAQCASADAVGRLYLAMLHEAASVELRARRRQTAYRNMLWDFLDHACATKAKVLNAA